MDNPFKYEKLRHLNFKYMLDTYQKRFMDYATRMSAVVCCRCSPTQKADIARLIQKSTKKRICCIGDGGNDVSMIQAAHVGVGIVGKEGKQASRAADFSVNQFSHITRLLCKLEIKFVNCSVAWEELLQEVSKAQSICHSSWFDYLGHASDLFRYLLLCTCSPV